MNPFGIIGLLTKNRIIASVIKILGIVLLGIGGLILVIIPFLPQQAKEGIWILPLISIILGFGLLIRGIQLVKKVEENS
ncbi:MAG: hypothetical protein LBV67_05900 [Streptococcaceae bacterium]|jgi:uncharacterized membrane protein|nr:hypothetical protein [Streptococcaceae bacterium]